MENLAAATISSAWALMAVSFAVIVARLVLRRLKHEQFTIDDFIMMFAVILYAVNTGTYPVAVNSLMECLRLSANLCVEGKQWHQC